MPGSSGDLSSMTNMMAKILMGVDITEIYSPERVINMTKQYGLSTGIAMDLMTGYDFNRMEGRRKAWNHLKQQTFVPDRITILQRILHIAVHEQGQLTSERSGDDKKSQSGSEAS